MRSLQAAAPFTEPPTQWKKRIVPPTVIGDRPGDAPPPGVKRLVTGGGYANMPMEPKVIKD